MVAHETREGQVFDRLLSKLHVENEALSGRVFDILGTVFEGTSLRDLLIQAVRADRDAAIRETAQKVDAAMDHSHLEALLAKRALAFNALDSGTVQRIRRQMERARLQRLQPYFIEAFFREAFSRLGGVMRKREARRWQIRNVPVELRRRDREIGTGTPLLSSYERITFHHDCVEGAGGKSADLVSSGHPLLDTVIDLTLQRYRGHLKTGTILIDRSEEASAEPYALVVLEHTILERAADFRASQRAASRRLLTVRVSADGDLRLAGNAPWLDLDSPRDDESVRALELIRRQWSHIRLEEIAAHYAATHLAPEHYEEISTRRAAQVAKTKTEVLARLSREIAYWDHRTEELRLKEKAGKSTSRINSENATRRRDDLQYRLAERIRDLESQAVLSSQVPVVTSIAMVVSAAVLARSGDGIASEQTPAGGHLQTPDAQARARIERIAMDAVAAHERSLGFEPKDVGSENRGYDIESANPADPFAPLRFIEVKGRAMGAEHVTVTRREMTYGFNNPQTYFLAIVLIGENGEVDGPHYVRNPFEHEPGWTEDETRHSIKRLLSV